MGSRSGVWVWFVRLLSNKMDLHEKILPRPTFFSPFSVLQDDPVVHDAQPVW